MSGREQVRHVEQLTDREAAMLDLARRWWKNPATKSGVRAQAIRDQFGWTPGQFYMALNALVETEAALAADPLLVKHLRVLRGQRHRSRAARHSPVDT